MQENYHAEVINLSQIDPDIFKHVTIIGVQKRFFGIVKIYKISISKENLEQVISIIQKNMSRKLKMEWYVTFHNPEKAIIVFREKKFELSTKGISPVYQKKLNTANADNKKQWDEMICYAESLHIPDNQLDFLPPGFRTENYY